MLRLAEVIINGCNRATENSAIFPYGIILANDDEGQAPSLYAGALPLETSVFLLRRATCRAFLLSAQAENWEQRSRPNRDHILRKSRRHNPHVRPAPSTLELASSP